LAPGFSTVLLEKVFGMAMRTMSLKVLVAY